jgi:hypothetical protein
MGKKNGLSGGGIEQKHTASYRDPKVEPRPHPVSVGAVSRLGGMVSPGTPLKTLYQNYNPQSASTPQGPTSGMDCRVGGNGRQILRAGSQSATPAPRPMPKGRPSF